MRIILGSSSPRRKELLGKIAASFEIISPDIDETPFPHETPDQFCMRASSEKARAVIPSAGEGEYLIISADTIVTIDGLILGKPSGKNDAVAMLRKLQGRTHQVKTAITLIRGGSVPCEITALDTTGVRFKTLSDDDIENYLSSIHYLDKAGSYAAQDNGNLIIEEIHGSMTNVIGFPQGLFFRMLHSTGLDLSDLA
jgi:septum formation protein